MRTALSILLFISTLGSAVGDVTIAGRVLDEASQPLAGIKVSVEDILMDPSLCCGPFRIVQTGADGSFRFDVPSSVYVVGTEPNPSFNPDRGRGNAMVTASGNCQGAGGKRLPGGWTGAILRGSD